MRPTCHQLNIVLLTAALTLLPLLIYWQSLGHDFVDFDDPLYVTENAAVQNGLTLHNAAWTLTANAVFNWHPLTWISLMTDYEIWRLDPKGYHLTNIILHVANTLLLFFILARMTGTFWRSAFVAALFAVHPLHVESVAWISERKDVLSGCLWFLTLGAYAYYAARPNLFRYAPVFLLLVLGLMAKPMLVSLPLVLILLDYWPLQRVSAETLFPPRNLGAWRPILLEKAPLIALALASCAITFIVQQRSGAVGTFQQYPFAARVATALMAYQDYIVNMFWPANLACLYPYQPHLPFWHVALAFGFLAAISALVVWLGRARRYLVVGWLWYLITLVPVIGLVQVGGQAMADRYSYLPLVGIFIMLAWGLPDFVENGVRSIALRRALDIALALLAVAVLGILTVLAWRQAGYWKNTITVFSRAIAVTENNSLAHNNLANALAGSGKLTESVYHYAKAIEIRPDYYAAYNNIGVSLSKMGRTNEALDYYRASLRIQPDCAETYVNIGKILVEQGAYDQALAHFAEAVRLNPYLVNAHNNMGIILARQGALPDAVNHFYVVTRLNPSNMGTYLNLIQGLLDIREYGKAVVFFREMLHTRPEWSQPMNSILWALTTRRGFSDQDRVPVLEMSKEAARFDHGDDPVFPDALGAAYAGLKRYAEAEIEARKALSRAQARRQTDLAGQIQRRLELYRNGQPYFED